MNSPFKGRISVTTDINGKKSTVDKEFTSRDEFDAFAASRGMAFNQFPSFDDMARDFFGAFHTPFGGMLGRSFGLHRFLSSAITQSGSDGSSVGPRIKDKYGLGKYEAALEDSAKKKRELEGKMNTVKELDEVLETLRGYEEKFRKEKNEAMLKSLEEDVKKYENRKKELEEELKRA